MPNIDFVEILRLLVIFLVPGVFAITVHEVAHGWVANKRGDPTALKAGRLTLNPIKHIDLIGTIIVPFALFMLVGWPFGWAKPVPVVFENLKSPRRDMILVAAAGPGSNLIMASIWALLMAALIVTPPMDGRLDDLVFKMATVGISINVLLAVFNMLPIPPLDGGRVLAGLLPPRFSAILDRIEPFGILIVLVLLISNVVFPLIDQFIGPLEKFFEDVARSLAGVP